MPLRAFPSNNILEFTKIFYVSVCPYSSDFFEVYVFVGQTTISWGQHQPWESLAQHIAMPRKVSSSRELAVSKNVFDNVDMKWTDKVIGRLIS